MLSDTLGPLCTLWKLLTLPLESQADTQGPPTCSPASWGPVIRTASRYRRCAPTSRGQLEPANSPPPRSPGLSCQLAAHRCSFNQDPRYQKVCWVLLGWAHQSSSLRPPAGWVSRTGKTQETVLQIQVQPGPILPVQGVQSHHPPCSASSCHPTQRQAVLSLTGTLPGALSTLSPTRVQ